jgi:hypothetical protein
VAGKFERYFFALGKASRALRDSARERGDAKVPSPPAVEVPSQPITLIRCTKCGTYIATGTTCTCSNS